MDTGLVLRQGGLCLVLEPQRGGACTALTWRAGAGPPVDLWRPLAPDEEVFMAACFPLVPYSNRLFDGRLLCSGGEHRIPRNHGRVEHPVHGEGWRHPWEVAGRGPDHAVLVYRHRADDHWPFDFTATQSVRLKGQGLRMALEVRNDGPLPMPAGLGLHPRFAIDPGDRVRWQGRQASDPWAIECNDGQPGWRGRATLDRRSHGLRLRLRSGARLRHLMAYRTAGAPWLCLEPVSHVTGAFSRPALHTADHGAAELPPGRMLRGWLELRIEPHAFPPTS